jgi:hypothetical protein
MRAKIMLPLKLSVVLLAAAMFLGCGPSCNEEYGCLRSGKRWRLGVTKLDRSVGGLARLNTARALLILDGSNKQIDLLAGPWKNDEWGDHIFTGISYRGVSLSSIQKDMVVHVEVQTPSDPSLIGQWGRIEYELDVTYPKLNAPENDNIIVRSICNSKVGQAYKDCTSWSEQRKVFRHVEPRVTIIADE